MAEHADVVIAGGAVMGSAVAYYLRKLGFSGSVRVIDKDLSYARCCTTGSAGGIRQQFSTEENIRLSRFGLDLLRRLKDEFGPEADVPFREQGYLILATREGESVVRANADLQQRMGAATVVLDRDGLSRRFPWLSTDGIAAGSLGERDEGWLDPWSLMMLFRKAAQSKGAVWQEAEITGVEIEAGKIAAVRLGDGGRIGCGALVNAAGPDAGAIAALAGIPLPVGRRKRYVFVIDCRDPPQALHRAPLTIDPAGAYFRPEGRQFICGLSPEEHEEPAEMDFEVDYGWFEERVWPILALRVPAFEAVKVVNAWSCHYDYNALDQNAVIGRHPEITNFYFCNGFSGHGLQQAPGAGNAVAELLMHGRYLTVDVKRFGYERVAEGRPFRELNVI